MEMKSYSKAFEHMRKEIKKWMWPANDEESKMKRKRISLGIVDAKMGISFVFVRAKPNDSQMPLFKRYDSKQDCGWIYDYKR